MEEPVVRSVANKMDKLGVLRRIQKEDQVWSIMGFTETWLQQHIPDTNASLPSFKMIQADRDTRSSSNSKGGGISVFINNTRCHPGHFTVKERVCALNIELLAVSLRPSIY